MKAWTSNHWTAREFSRMILSSIRQILSCLLQALQCIYCLTQSCVQYCVPSESLFPTLPSPAALQPPLIALLFLCRLRWIYHPGARSARPQKPKGAFLCILVSAPGSPSSAGLPGLFEAATLNTSPSPFLHFCVPFPPSVLSKDLPLTRIFFPLNRDFCLLLHSSA